MLYSPKAIAVYGPDHRLRKSFVTSIKAVLDDLTVLAEELRNSFPVQTNRGLSRLAAHLHLHHLQVSIPNTASTSSELTLCSQMIILVTRPLLFCSLQRIFQTPVDTTHLPTPPKVHHVMTVSLDAAHNILAILSSLQDQDLLGTQPAYC